MEEFKAYHKGTNVVKFLRREFIDGTWFEFTYDENGELLTFEDSEGYYEIKYKEVTKEEFEIFTNQ